MSSTSVGNWFSQLALMVLWAIRSAFSIPYASLRRSAQSAIGALWVVFLISWAMMAFVSSRAWSRMSLCSCMNGFMASGPHLKILVQFSYILQCLRVGTVNLWQKMGQYHGRGKGSVSPRASYVSLTFSS